MSTDWWQFWLDVGGTFTDCLARNGIGETRRCKVLSSAVVRGEPTPGLTANSFTDQRRRNEPDDFWVGYAVRFLNSAGNELATAEVTHFSRDSCKFSFDMTTDTWVQFVKTYELVSPDPAPLLAVRLILGLRLDESLPPILMRLGTTRGTNALLTRTGAKTALVTTQGFADILHIGNQDRPKLFELNIQKPAPLFSAVLEIKERLTAQGEVLLPLDLTQAKSALIELRAQGIESLAICLLNAYCQKQHETALLQLVADIGFTEVCISSQVAPTIKLVSRAATTVLDAYLNPVLREYVAKIAGKLHPDSSLRLLTSAGGLVSATAFSGKDSILSGPAGGVVGYAAAARVVGSTKAIGFDMGGTSTDVSRYDGKFELEYETEKAGTRIVAPMLAIETVAAGGGSICRFDGVKLCVGPKSAGADPGPACYGLGGPVTVTDINLFLGKLSEEQFPLPLHLSAVEQRLAEIQADIAEGTGKQYDLKELAEGFLQIANQNMAAAIRSISVAKGYDPADYLLVAFGGAAGGHACAVADLLGMEQILSHPDAGILSAYGIGLADVIRHASRGIYAPLSAESLKRVQATCKALKAETEKQVIAEGVPREQVSSRAFLDLRYVGTDSFLTQEWDRSSDPRGGFEKEHERLYGYIYQGRELEIVAARVESTGRSQTELPISHRGTPREVSSKQSKQIRFAGTDFAANVYNRTNLKLGDTFTGPALLLETTATTVVDPGWQAEVLSGGEILLTKAEVRNQPLVSKPTEANEVADPILLEIFNNQFAAIAEQMGITLQNTASSVNVKERLDFSCAIFTAAGNLVVNAPHIPVHLGAMSETVKCILADNPDLGSGDVVVTNDPYRGGSHLPDVTVVTPVFAKAKDQEDAPSELLFFTASRAHHAEIGGITPGSMPPFSRTLAEEGVLIRNFKVVQAGTSRMDALEQVLLSGEHPSRSPSDNLADLQAQLAANQQGATQLLEMVADQGRDTVLAYMKHIQDAAARKTRQKLATMSVGKHAFTDYLDDGSPICVTVEIEQVRVEPSQAQATIDFTGTGDVLPGNLNANRGIVSAAVMYCLRCLIDEDIPLNEGVLQAVKIILPECLLNPPAHPSPAKCAAVVGGNVETSQRVVDVLLAAFGLAAASQGTMNNLLFGNETFGFYETICGGSGATATAPGASAVHTHMTNTRITDPEVMEQRYPVRVVEFKIRSGSGGGGIQIGGDGCVRVVEFLAPLRLSLVSQRRGKYPTFGLQGGEPGLLGKNTLIRSDGTIEELGELAEVQVAPGDRVVIQTPGGGGFGEKS